ncbi:hypothetical protein SRB17_27970 [Streptomyces sp. RB17]|uniref:hypothetical protein n=1 Tax=Streptomyces sp. RB17 TaxID=2585197 RepID=UPI0012956431|nr:hypothetical protein [Streptomyces sp. RB17]MQY34827.1 hypothetical protein [Streptomyces sp. RB17]
MDSEDHVCPVCGRPVDTVVGRRKTLGAWVPVWGPGPCRNPDCAAYGKPVEPAAPEAPDDGTGPPHPGESAAGTS